MAGVSLNCFWLFIPVFIWNAIFYKKLPEFYQPAIWDNIPKALDVAENGLRYLSFLIPILLKIGFSASTQKIGLALYLGGLLVYFASWSVQLNPNRSVLSKSLGFRLAPAYTTIIWLLGIGLIGRESWFSSFNLQALYFPIIIAFVSVHTYHSYTVYRKTKA